MSRIAATLAIAGAATGVLAACSGPQPFIDMRREAGTLTTVGSSNLNRPAVCYNTMNATREEVQALADAVCAETQRVAVYQSTDVLMCTVLQPHRSFFTCVAPEHVTTTAGGVRRVKPGVLGPQIPGAGPTPEPAAEEPDDLPIPDAPATPARPNDPDADGLLDIF